MGNSLSVKWLGKVPGAQHSIGYRFGAGVDKALGKALGTGPKAPPPGIPTPPPPETIDEGAYLARDRTRRRARLIGGANSTQTGASALPYSPAPKALLGS